MSNPDPQIWRTHPIARSFHLQNEDVLAFTISLCEIQNCKGNGSSGDLLVDFILN